MIGLVLLFMALYAAQQGNYIAGGLCILIAIYALLFVKARF